MMDPVNTKNIAFEVESNKSLINKAYRVDQPETVKREKNNSTDEKIDTDNLDNEHLNSIADNMNNFLQSIQTDLQVEIHKGTNKVVFKILKREDKTVIAEIPPSKLLDIEVRIREMVGSLYDANV